MATYTRLPDGTAERHGVRAILTASGIEKIATLWLKTATGLQKIYESVRSCFGSGRWVGAKRWLGKEKWKSIKMTSYARQ